ncbi:uncharacterized protein G2W53_042156 [Senna tora]|uniref:Uncharacterized protein n=1 Tax=Senna tora TaxID=362788 RepID=A0A834VZP6_9FABA|nr:uncharacterized protein G2W53_042156 [Senna tora]
MVGNGKIATSFCMKHAAGMLLGILMFSSSSDKPL